jgi:hypothetical protein
MNNVKTMPAPAVATIPADVYCPICTHTVPASVTLVRNAAGKRVAKAIPGQRCPRCTSPLDAAFVVRVNRAA